MLTTYANEAQEELLYQEYTRTSDFQMPRFINYLLLATWLVICAIGFAIIFIGKQPIIGTMVIALPTFVGMVIKPSFGLCMFMLVLPTSAGAGIAGVFTIGRGVGMALAAAFAINLLITRPALYIRNKAIWVFILYVLWVLFASFASPYPLIELTVFFTHFQLLLLVLITYWILETNSEKAFLWVLRSYVIGMLGTIIITFITGAAMRSMTEVHAGERYGATLGQTVDRNMMGALIVLGFLAAIYLFARDRNLLWRTIYIIAIIFLPIMILRTGSRSASIALAFTLLSPLLFIRQVWHRPALALLLLLAIILASSASSFIVETGGLAEQVEERLTNIDAAKRSLDYRMSLNTAAVNVAFSRLFGSGVIAWFEASGVRHYPHADFFRALGYYGVPGAALWVLFVIMMLLTIKRTPLTTEKIFSRAILTFLLVMGLGIGQLTEKYYWIFLTIAMAAERIGNLFAPERNISDGYAEYE